MSTPVPGARLVPFIRGHILSTHVSWSMTGRTHPPASLRLALNLHLQCAAMQGRAQL